MAVTALNTEVSQTLQSTGKHSGNYWVQHPWMT